MDHSLQSAIFTPSDSVLLVCGRFAPVQGRWARFKRKSVSWLTTVGALVAAGLGALLPTVAAYFEEGLSGLLASAAFVGAFAWLWIKLSGRSLQQIWKRVKTSEGKRDGTVNPLGRGHTVVEEPLATALVSTALLANESAGVVQLVLANNVLQVAPTGSGRPWQAASLEDRLRRNKRLPVADLVEDWLESSSESPYRRAVGLAEQGMVTRGLAAMSHKGDAPEAVLTGAASLTASAIDGSAASMLLEACRKERPQVWKALQEALAEAFEKRRIARELGYSAGVNHSFDVAFSRGAPLGFKIENQKTVRYASEKDEAPVELLEARPLAVGPGPDPATEYATQRRIAAKLPAWTLWIINRLKKLIPPDAAEVQSAVKGQMRVRKMAASGSNGSVEASPSRSMTRSASIPTRLFDARELPPPTAAHYALLNRTGGDWARVFPPDSARSAWLVATIRLLLVVPFLWRWWRRRRARARLLKSLRNPLRLLMLRVFGSPSYDDLIGLIEPWRRVGVIQHLEGFDTVGTRPEAIAAVKAGRPADILVETREEVERELSALSLKPGKDFLFERQSFQCTSGTWQFAMHRMMDRADAVVMDLSSLSPTNRGCAWEIGQLLERVPLSRVTLLVNDSTDLGCLQTLLDDAAGRVAANSPNQGDAELFWRLVRIGGLAARQPNESHFDWKRRIDIRLEPEVLTGFLMSTAQPRRSQTV